MLEISLNGFAQSDVRPMRAAPFAVFKAENSQDQRPGLLLSGGFCGKKTRISAWVAGLPAVLSLHLTAVSAPAFRFCTPAVR
jgi:hypothetical protein